MSMSRKDEARLLTKEEADLVAKTRAPTLHSLPDSELAQLVVHLRERRRRARDIADRQSREMRGKASPSGTKPAARSDGTRRKSEALAAAVKRVNNERLRRAKASAEPSQSSIARKALRMKRAAGELLPKPRYRTASKGMRPIESTHHDDLSRRSEVGRVTKYVASAQAARDAKHG